MCKRKLEVQVWGSGQKGWGSGQSSKLGQRNRCIQGRAALGRADGRDWSNLARRKSALGGWGRREDQENGDSPIWQWVGSEGLTATRWEWQRGGKKGEVRMQGA